MEELVSPTPFVDFVEMHCGLWEIGVLAPNFLTDKRPGVYFGPLFLAIPDVSGEPSPRCRPIVRKRLWGCEDGPEWRRGAAADPPPPRAPGDPTPITLNVEELVSPTPFLVFPGKRTG